MRSTCLAILLLVAAPLFGGESQAAGPPAPVDEAGAAPAVAAPAPKKKTKGTRRAKAKATETGTGKETTPGSGKGTGKGTRSASKPGVLAKAPPATRFVRSGFRLTEGGSEVVLQTSAEVELETGGNTSAPTFVLKRCRATRANDRRPLDTRFFGTTVTGIALRQRGGDLIVRVTLKGAATTATRKEHGPGDTWSWILTFTAPSTDGRVPASPSSPQRPSAPTATAAVLR